MSKEKFVAAYATLPSRVRDEAKELFYGALFLDLDSDPAQRLALLEEIFERALRIYHEGELNGQRALAKALATPSAAQTDWLFQESKRYDQDTAYAPTADQLRNEAREYYDIVARR